MVESYRKMFRLIWLLIVSIGVFYLERWLKLEKETYLQVVGSISFWYLVIDYIQSLIKLKKS